MLLVERGGDRVHVFDPVMSLYYAGNLRESAAGDILPLPLQVISGKRDSIYVLFPIVRHINGCLNVTCHRIGVGSQGQLGEGSSEEKAELEAGTNPGARSAWLRGQRAFSSFSGLFF